MIVICAAGRDGSSRRSAGRATPAHSVRTPIFSVHASDDGRRARQRIARHARVIVDPKRERQLSTALPGRRRESDAENRRREHDVRGKASHRGLFHRLAVQCERRWQNERRGAPREAGSQHAVTPGHRRRGLARSSRGSLEAFASWASTQAATRIRRRSAS